MVSLIDTNIIIRFLVADNEEQFKIAKDIFFEIEKSQRIVIILDVVFMEAFFVLTKLLHLLIKKGKKAKALKIFLNVLSFLKKY